MCKKGNSLSTFTPILSLNLVFQSKPILYAVMPKNYVNKYE